MKTEGKSKGTWIHRFAIRLFTLVLAVLIFWVLGFFVGDSSRNLQQTINQQKYQELRRTVNKIVVPGDSGVPEENYTCPSCGCSLFEECPSCHKVRHAMLSNCSHCGAKKGNQSLKTL